MKFDMGAAWQDATTMIGRNREVLLVVAGIFFFLPALVQAMLIPGMEEIFADVSDPEALQARMFDLYTSWGWLFAITFILSLVGYLALLALLRDASRPTVGDAIKGGFIGLLPAIGTYLLFTIALGLVVAVLMAVAAASGSTLLGVLTGIAVLVLIIYAAVKVSLSAPVIALDRVYNPLKVLARSWRLTKGNSFRIFLFYLLIIIVYIVVMMIVGLIASLTMVALGQTAGLFISGIISAFIGAGVAILYVAILAAIHRQMAGPSAEAMGETFG